MTDEAENIAALYALVERVDGEPFADDERPMALDFHFDVRLGDSAAHRFAFACVTCTAGVVLCGVTVRGTVICRRCDRTMPLGVEA